ncbi:MAG: hypothetical protein R2806_03780 [Saprospiraceae bacterium]
MINTTPATRILLADRRKRSGQGFLTVVPPMTIHDWYLDPGASLAGHSRVSEVTLFLPYVGDVIFDGEGGRLQVEEHQALASCRSNKPYRISNPYPEDAINLLQVSLTSNLSFNPSIIDRSWPVDSPWIPMHPQIQLGRFGGRDEATILADEWNKTVLFVVQGAFEVQHCLLENRDGLLVEGQDDIEIEALSPDAEILVIHLE